jgi:DNA repair ATPase RecN
MADDNLKKTITSKQTVGIEKITTKSTETPAADQKTTGEKTNGEDSTSPGSTGTPPAANNTPGQTGAPANKDSQPPSQDQQTNPEDENSPENPEDKKDDKNPEKKEDADKTEEDKNEEKKEEGEEGEGEKPSEESSPKGEAPEGAGEPPVEGAGAGEAGAGAEGAAAGEGAAAAETGAAAAEGGAAAAEGAAAAAEAGAAAAEGAAAAGGAIAFGWIILLVLIAILLIAIIVFGIMACNAAQGGFGKSSPVPSGPNYANAATVLTAAATGAKTPAGKPITGQNKINLSATDQKFIKDGKADKRLLDLLNHIGDEHSSLTISSIISGFEPPTSGDKDTTNDPEFGGQNSSAHAEGLAADVSTIDNVYKTDEVSQTCQEEASAACGPFAPLCKSIVSTIKLGNLVYYSDQQDSNSNVSAAPADLDDSMINAKISAQQAVLSNAQSTLTQAKDDFGHLKDQLNQTITNLKNQQSNNALSPDQKNQLQIQINKTIDISNNIGDLAGKIDNYNQQLVSYGQTINGLETKLSSFKKTLQNIQNINSKLGSNKSSDVDSAANSMINDINKIFPKLDDVATKIQDITSVISSLDSTNQVNIQALVSVTGGSVGDAATYLNDVTTAVTNANMAKTTALDGIGQSQSAMNDFTKAIESLITSAASQTFNQLISGAKQQLEQAINDQLNSALGNLGISPFGSDSLIYLPCVGFVVPGLSDIPGGSSVSGTISSITNSDLTKNILDNVNKVDSQITQASNELGNASTKINQTTQTVNNQIQGLYNAMAPKIQSVENAINKTTGITNTYLTDIDAAAGTAKAVGNGNVNVFGQGQLGSMASEIDSLIQGAASQSFNLSSSASNSSSVGDVKQTVQTAQNNLTQDKATAEQIKSQFNDLVNGLKQGKANLSVQVSGSSVTQTERDQIQKEIDSVQSLIDTVNGFANQINSYEQQIDSINQKIGQAQQALTQLKSTIDQAKNVYNQVAGIPGKLNSLIAQIIPSAMMPYAVVPNTNFDGNQYSQAVPIQVKWQDDSPGAQYVGNKTDDKSIINDLIFYIVYRPEAQRKVHELIQQTLQAPTDLNNKYYYRPSQLITFSNQRDVQPFADTLNSLYGLPRAANLGLFALPQSWSQIHIAY